MKFYIGCQWENPSNIPPLTANVRVMVVLGFSHGQPMLEGNVKCYIGCQWETPVPQLPLLHWLSMGDKPSYIPLVISRTSTLPSTNM